MNSKKAKITSSIIAIIITILIIIGKDFIIQFKSLGYLGILIISFAGNATVFLPTPVLMTVAVMGSTLHPVLVGFFASFGAAMGESVGYFLGVSGNLVVEKSTHYQKAKIYIDKFGVFAIAFLAAIPNPLFDIAGILAGATGISFSRFFLATWAGTFVKYTLVSFLGFSLLGF